MQKKWAALAYESTHLWYLEVTPSNSETLRIDGHWAGYTDKAASLFQHGEVSGSGRWIVRNEELSVSLEFKNLQSGLRKNSAFVLKRVTGVSGQNTSPDAEFLRGFTSADFAQPILYNEVIPRQLAWGQEIETQFLTRLSPLVAVLRLPDGSAPINVDGKLEEPAWNSLLLDTGQSSGTLPGTEGSGDAKALFRYDSKGLYFAFSVGQTPSKPQVALTLLTRFDLPLAQSTRWSVVLGKEGIQASRLEVLGRQTPWQCQWQTGDFRIEWGIGGGNIYSLLRIAGHACAESG